MDATITPLKNLAPFGDENLLPAVLTNEAGFSYGYVIPPIDNERVSRIFMNVPPDEHAGFVGYEMDGGIPKAELPDYCLAAGSGLLTGVLSVLWNKMPTLVDLRNAGSETTNKLVMDVAKAFGGKPTDLVDAIRFLEQKFPIPADSLAAVFGGALQHHLRDFAHHPTPLGLLFSIITQFTGVCFGTDTSGAFIVEKLSEHACIGKNVPEKIFLGVVNWLFHLVSDMAGSSGAPGKGTGIPGLILAAMKEISALPIFRNIRVDYKEGEISFSQLISKLFNGTFFREENGKPISFDLRAEIGIGEYIMKSSLPVIINECITRAAFTIRQLYREIKDNDIQSFADLSKINLTKIAPWNNRILTRMCTVSSGVFMAVNLAGTAVKTKGDAKKFFLYINYPGLIRFAFACVADAEYIKEDIKGAYNSFMSNRTKAQYNAFEAQRAVQDSIRYFELSEPQNLLLLTIKRKAVVEDISRTGDAAKKKLKEEWLQEWEASLREALQCENPFLDERVDVHQALKDEMRGTGSTYWYYILLLEANSFVPYLPFGEESAEKYRGLKFDYPYIRQVFFKEQKVLPERRVNSLINTYNNYSNLLDNSLQKKMIQIGAAVGVSVLGGLGAYVFAPAIAGMLVGGAFAGLHGAALTSASLAMLGGGSLVAGGFGMAGGTAVITGGGALLSLLGSGAISTIALMQGISSPFVLSECAKQLTVCKYASYGMNSDYKPATDILYIMQSRIDEMKSELELNPAIRQDKAQEKALSDSINILKASYAELKKILQD